MSAPLLKGEQFHLEFVVSEQVYSRFIETFGDVNPMHTDDPFAQSHGFPRRIVHGNVMSGFVSYFVGMGLPLRNVMLLGQTIQYVNPIFVDDPLEFVATVLHWSDSVNVAEFKYTFKKTDGSTASKGKILVKILKETV